jgi:catechol 2,3-dioxygenase-like lactoylglutathione lyase family enzyme
MTEEKKKTETDGPSVGGCSNIGIHHVGLCAKDPSLTAEFYRDVMGMQIVGGSSADAAPIGASAFLSSRPEEESHEIALFTNPEIRHVAFKVASLAELRSFYQRICARKPKTVINTTSEFNSVRSDFCHPDARAPDGIALFGQSAGGRDSFGTRSDLLISTNYMLNGPSSIATRQTSSLNCLPAENCCTSSMTS